MAFYLLKLLLSAAIIVAVTELSKRSSWLGGLLASLPLISLLSIIWLYVETKDVGKVAALSRDVFWLVLPSLPFFLVLPALLKRWTFVPSLLGATLVMFAAYGVLALIQRWYSVE